MMRELKTFWGKIKMVLMFTWRHLFTLFIGALALNAFLFATYTPIVWRVGATLAAAIAFDWLKMKFKGRTDLHPCFDGVKPHDWGRFTPRTTTGNVHNGSPYSERFIPGTTSWYVHSYSRDWDRFTPGTSAWNSRY